MKLTSHRPIDQAHTIDMLSVGLIDSRVKQSLPEELRQRLDAIDASQAE